ncbi:MAG: efflux RND transporter periplasmic adaptor subunit [Elusimicrobia bacterium]|nr:efflux RND transporter periplasmic adaptor subunit [Elusimicrobiota bacterium]
MELNWKHKTGAIALGSVGILALNLWINPSKYARSVNMEIVERKDMKIKILSTGLLAYKNAVEVKSEIAESVVKKYVSEGERVRAGDILLKLSSTKQKITFEKETNRLKESENEVVKARKELVTQRDLFAKQAVARSSVEKADGDLAKAQTNFDLVKQEFALERKNMEKTLVVSESSGMVLIDYVQNQQSIEQNKPLFVIGTPGQFQVNAKVDELNIQNVFEGANADVQIDAFPNVTLQGKVARIESQAESGAFSKIGIKIEILDTKGLELRPNLTAQGFIYGSEIKQVIWLPTLSIKTEGNEKYVYVLEAGNRAKKKTIVTGRVANDMVEISEGLNPGEKVISSDIDFIKDNEIVKIKSDTSAR